MLNAQPEWTVWDDDFDAEDFFLSIVELFESNPQSVWVRSTIKWWNM